MTADDQRHQQQITVPQDQPRFHVSRRNRELPLGPPTGLNQWWPRQMRQWLNHATQIYGERGERNRQAGQS
ncbi:hypothetical protein BaRGS_00031051 [Batillaria attramentaria]|uniref:Uncharacterized protein n=1 Tax=Batillaria attramentaria TaxID=370345 RepID=A0ABD0JRR9_9CAEN